MELRREYLGLIWLPPTGHNDGGFLYAIGGDNESEGMLASVECIRTGRHASRPNDKVTFLSNAWYSVAPMMHARLGFGAAVVEVDHCGRWDSK